MENVARIDELERKYAENPRRYFAPLANEYRKAGDATRAIDLCRAQLPEIPGHISGHIVLAQALYDSGDLTEARSAFEAALILDPENILALRYLGDIGRQEGDPVEAERWYRRTLEADPHNEAAVVGMELIRSGGSSPQVQEPVPEPAEAVAPPVEVIAEPVELTVEVIAAPAAIPEFAPAVEEKAAIEPDPAIPPAEAEDESAAIAERVLELAAPFVTETMADLYLEQGYVAEALDLLRQLAEQRRGDAPLLEKIAALEARSRAEAHSASAVPAEAETAFTDSGSHHGLPQFEPLVEPAARDVATAPTALSDLLPAGYGIEAPVEDAALAPELSGEPAMPAPRTIRDFLQEMDRSRPQVVFRQPPAGAAPLSPESAGPLPFWEKAPVRADDEAAARELASVFAQGPSHPARPAEEPAPPEQPAAPVARVSGPHPAFDPATADMKQFDAWLRGLKTP